MFILSDDILTCEDPLLSPIDRLESHSLLQLKRVDIHADDHMTQFVPHEGLTEALTTEDLLTEDLLFLFWPSSHSRFDSTLMRLTLTCTLLHRDNPTYQAYLCTIRTNRY